MKSKIRVFIQSRLSSQRLPAKSLLPIAGMPSLALSALRAANTGLEVVIATSQDTNDDLTQAISNTYGLKCIRGPLSDVLTRMEKGTHDLPSDSILVRLTADNMFPDGNFIEGLVKRLHDEKLSFLGTHSPSDGLPYGLSAEAFTFAAFKAAFLNAPAADRENVTPWIKRNFESIVYRPEGLIEGYSHLRCTLDTFDDYVLLAKFFSNIDDPVRINWKTLCEKFAEMEGQPRVKIPYKLKGNEIHSKMTLGTAQLGLEYGVANKTGKPDFSTSKKILKTALKHGVLTYDSSSVYGDSEHILGQVFNGGLMSQATVITKLSPMDWIPHSASEKLVKSAVDASVFKSCRALNLDRLPVLLLHRWQDYFIFKGIIWSRLKELQKMGVIQKLGASVYSPEEAIEALEDEAVAHLQIPFNILDWRWQSFDAKGVTVHARSTLLQGLLCSDAQWPDLPDVNREVILKKLGDLAQKFGRKNRTDLCFAYSRSIPWISSLVIGVESEAQLMENLELFQRPALTPDERKICDLTLGRTSRELLEIYKWIHFVKKA